MFWRWRRFFYLVFLGLTVLVAGGAYVVARVELPPDPPAQAQTNFICSSDIQTDCNATNAMAQIHGTEDRSIVPYAKIPKILREAVLSAEDREFFHHSGVDPIGLARAAWADLRSKGAQQGGSTITQQYVKNTYLDQQRTVIRKAREAILAVKLDRKVPKKEILSRYLNSIYFGRGAYGVAAASQVWFGHDLSTLRLDEAAFLAGLIRAPQTADPYGGRQQLAEAQRRREAVLSAMKQEHYITVTEQRAALGTPLQWPYILPQPNNADLGAVKGSNIGTKYFVEYVRQFLYRRFKADAVLKGGLKVYTTIDLTMQKAAFDAVTSTLDRPGDPAAALVAVDDHGQVKAMMGGTDFEHQHVNLAVGTDGGGSGRQPGSTFKAFALAEAVKQGYSLQSRFRAPPTIEIPNGDGPGKPWKPRGGLSSGSANLITATQYSVNTVYAQLVDTLGPDKVIAMARQLGVSTSARLPPYDSIVLGAGQVSVLDMAAAYSTFANEGQRLTPVVVTRVERGDGSVVDLTPKPTQVLAREEAARVSYTLQKVVSGGTGTAAAIGRPAAGKTGTTSTNVDAWFVGYTPRLTAAVWMGFPSGNVPMTDVHGISVQGGTFPAEMWRKFMLTTTANVDTGTFPDPGPLDVGTLINTGLRPFSGIGPINKSGQPRRTTTTSAPSSVPSRRSTTTTSSGAPTSSPRTTGRPSTTTTTRLAPSSTSTTTGSSSTAPASSTAPKTTTTSRTSTPPPTPPP